MMAFQGMQERRCRSQGGKLLGCCTPGTPLVVGSAVLDIMVLISIPVILLRALFSNLWILWTLRCRGPRLKTSLDITTVIYLPNCSLSLRFRYHGIDIYPSGMEEMKIM